MKKPEEMTKAELEHEVGRWRRLHLDQPEDRLWHDKDRTWWLRRDDTHLGVGALYRAAPPEPIRQLVEVGWDVLKLLRKLASKETAAKPLIKRIEKLIGEPEPKKS